MGVPEEQLVWRLCRRRPPLKASVDGWFLPGGITPVWFKTTVVQRIPASCHNFNVGKTPPRIMKCCVCRVALYEEVKLNIKTEFFPEYILCKSMIGTMYH